MWTRIGSLLGSQARSAAALTPAMVRGGQSLTCRAPWGGVLDRYLAASPGCAVLEMRPLPAPRPLSALLAACTLQAPAAPQLLPALVAVSTLLPGIVWDGLLLTGKGKYTGKNKRHPKKCNHGARPCSHIARRQRAAADGRTKYKPKP